MSRPVTAHIDEAELKMKEPASQEDVERRGLVASRLRSLIDRPITDAEREFWREFEAELEKERLREVTAGPSSWSINFHSFDSTALPLPVCASHCSRCCAYAPVAI